MANEPKTPGEVAWEAYISTLVETPDRAARGGYSSPAWAAAAQAVRKQLQEEIKANWAAPGKTLRLLGEVAVEDIVAVAELKKHLAWWHDQDWNYDYEVALSALIEAVEPFLPDEPKPEAAGACAEDAGAEPSKSPPPAKR